MKSSCPASLDTLKISVPPAVKLDAAGGARPALDLDDFVAYYNPKNSDKSRAGRRERREFEQFKGFTYGG
jgi:hypothetical protein